MARKSTQIFTEKSLESCRRCLIVHDLDASVKKSDINKIIAKALNNNTIKFHVHFGELQFAHDRQSQCATVSFPSEENVNTIMRNRPIRFLENELLISREIPKKYFLSHQITYGLKVGISTNNMNSTQNKQIDLREYFKHYGQFNYVEYVHDKAYFVFDDYDIVDRIILEKDSHKYKGIPLIVDKIRVPKNRRTIVSSDIPEFCIHVTNMPTNVSSEELSSIFKVDIANILVRPYHELNNNLVESNRQQVEAWIKEIGNEQSAQRLATEKTGTDLRGFKIQSQAIRASLNIFDLCKHFQEGTCSFSIGCNMKHILCVEPVDCNNTRCWYGHTSQRRTRSERRPISSDDGYRIRITNFPPDAKRPEILKRLSVNYTQILEKLILCNESEPNEPIIAYVIDQNSEIIAKRLIQSWHNQLFSTEQPYRMKCQLEINVEYFNSTIGIPLPMTPQMRSQTPSIISSINSMTIRKSKAVQDLRKQCTLLKSMNKFDHQYSNVELPFPWSWTSAESLTERMNQASHVYSIIDQTDPTKQAEIRIYSTMSDRTSRLRLQRHQIVLEQLKELDGIPKLINCNYDRLKNNSELSTKLWMITEPIKGVTLDTYVSDRSPNFRQIMNIILISIDLIKQIHNRNIVHRNLIPKNILINHSNSINGEQIHLGLIDFDLAYIDQKNNKKTNRNILTSIDHPLENDFYLIPQFEVEPLNNNDIDDENQEIKSERQSKTIDTSFICAILFWMITLKEPKVSRNIDGKAPHEINEHKQLIEDELKKATGKCQRKLESLRRHLNLIFDRGFGKSEQQWSINELEYQIRFIIELITNMKNHDEIFQYLPTMPLTSALSTEPSARLLSFIKIMKGQFVTCYSHFNPTSWSENQWSGDNQKIVYYDMLKIGTRELPFKFEIVRIEKENNLRISVFIKMNDTTIVELPFGLWQENEIEKDIESIMKTFITEVINFYNLLF